MQQTSLKGHIIILLAVAGAFLFIIGQASPLPAKPVTTATSTQVAASAAAFPESTSTAATSTPKAPVATTAKETKPKAATVKKATPAATKTAPAAATTEIHRIADPYPTPPESFTTINVNTRAALVNILCQPKNGSMRPISGSGILIDPRGVILTNAHVAQYVLLSQSPQVDLSCFIRAGSPATAHWIPRVLYMPPVWVEGHAADIMSSHPTGTGEHDYALLYITASADGTALPASFPAVSIDTREAIGFLGDQVLVASYPAEFVGFSVQSNLYSASSVTNIRQLLTFQMKSVDVLSVGGVIGAQSGSSGGAIVNAWGRLVGLITTTSEGATTADRDLRGITLSYINRDIQVQTGFDLSATIAADPAIATAEFGSRTAPRLITLLLDQILR